MFLGRLLCLDGRSLCVFKGPTMYTECKSNKETYHVWRPCQWLPCPDWTGTGRWSALPIPCLAIMQWPLWVWFIAVCSRWSKQGYGETQLFYFLFSFQSSWRDVHWSFIHTLMSLPFLYLLWIFWYIFLLLQLMSQNKLTLGFLPYSS